MKWACVSLAVLSLGLAACDRNRDVTLTKFTKTGNGPDEFTIVPHKPLETPPTLTELPPPTLGQPNRADLDPAGDAVAALGGNPVSSGAIPASDGALVTYAARKGIEPGVRQALAVEDARIRRSYGRVNILSFGDTDDYTDAYKREWLDADYEEARMRAAGVSTPSAPPPGR